MKYLILVFCIVLPSCSGLSLSVTAETPYGKFDYQPPSVEPTK